MINSPGRAAPPSGRQTYEAVTLKPLDSADQEGGFFIIQMLFGVQPDGFVSFLTYSGHD
jgi:hypothetical protein